MNFAELVHNTIFYSHTKVKATYINDNRDWKTIGFPLAVTVAVVLPPQRNNGEPCELVTSDNTALQAFSGEGLARFRPTKHH